MDEQTVQQRLERIIEIISGDVRRMEAGGAAALGAMDVAELVDEAAALPAAVRTVGVDRLSADDAEAAARALPLWERQIARMGKAELLELTHNARARSDRAVLHIIGNVADDAEVQRLACAPLAELPALVSAVRQAGANWRSLSRMTPEARRERAALQARLDAGPEAAEPTARVGVPVGYSNLVV